MTNGAARKLDTSRRKWKKTTGEYLLRFTSVGLALIAIAYGLYVSGYFDPAHREAVMGSNTAVISAPDTGSVEQLPKKTEETGETHESMAWQNAERFVISYSETPAIGSMLLIAASTEGVHQAEASALSEAFSSYFGIDIEVLPHDKTTPTDIDRHAGVIVLGNSDFTATEAMDRLVSHLAQKSFPTFWIGGGFTIAADAFGLEYTRETGIIELPENSLMLFGGVEIDASGLPFVRGVTGFLAGESEILASLRLHGVFERPAAFRKGQLTYLPFIPLPKYDAPLTLAVAVSLLSDIVGSHEKDPRVVFRLEDINARNYGASDTSFVKTVDFLLAENVPIHLGIIPRMVDQDGEQVADIDQAPAVLEYASKYPDNVLIAQHGSYHHRLDERNKGLASGDAWEFFFDDDDTMGTEASANFARERLEEGLKIMKAAGMKKPLMFEAPHYEMSPAQQRVADQLYPVMLHQPLFFGKEVMFYSPTLAWFTQRGNTVYAPGSAGYIDALQEKSVEYILYTLGQLASILPDPVVFVYYHPFMSEYEGREDDLVALIEGIKKHGYRFVNVLEELEPVRPE